MSFLGLLLLLLFDDQNQWPSFRGNGTSTTNCDSLPTSWDSETNIAWKVRLTGYGQSSPVVCNGMLYVTSVDGESKETNLAASFDTKTGEKHWEKRFSASQPAKNNPSVSRAAPTPVVDKSGITVLFESGDLIRLSNEGETKWERKFASEFGQIKNHHGIASSLAQSDHAVIVLLEHGGTSFLMAVDKENGKTLWKIDRQSGLSWSSPVVAKFGQKECVLLSSNGSAAIHDAENGKELWSIKGLTGNLIPSVTFSGNYIVIAAGEGGLIFDAEAARKSNRVFKVVTQNNELKCEQLWESNRILAHHASPVVQDSRVYFLTKVGILYCVDLESGKELYVKRLDNSCWATPIVARERIYFFGKDGTTTVIKRGPKFEKLAVNRLWDESSFTARKEASRNLTENKFPTLPDKAKVQMEAMLEDAVGDVVYGVAAADNSIYLRTGTELICVRDQRSR